jgi:glycosyltransferase involved in cell wall biosynthesis
MKILIVSQYFWPEYFRINDLAIELSKNKIEVDVLTGLPNYPHGRIFDTYKKNKKNYSKLKDINIYRIPLIPRFSGSNLALFFNYISFLISGLIFGIFKLRKKKYDFVITYATSPILVALISILVCKIKKIKHFIWVQDLWPHVLNDLNILKKESFFYRIFEKLVIFIYKNSDIILCQSTSYKKKIANLDSSLKDKLVYFPSWPEDQLNYIKTSNIFDQKNLNILFTGNIGESQNFAFIIKIIKELKQANIIWHVIGEGREFKTLQNEKKINNLDKLILYGIKKFEDIQGYFNQADLLLISLKKGETYESTIPGKFQTYLQYRKPILGILGGETYNLIKKYKLGIAYLDDDEKFIASQLLNFQQNKDNNIINVKNFSILDKIFSKKRAITKLIIYFRKLLNFKKLKIEMPIIIFAKQLDYKKNFILCGLNLAFLGYYSKGALPICRINILWPDGYFTSRHLKYDIKKLPGRELIQNMDIDKTIIKKIVILGFLDKAGINYIKNKFQLEVEHIDLPFGDLPDFKKYIRDFSDNELIFCTLPTPKQEQLANYIFNNSKNTKIICIGGAINMLTGLEKPLPNIFKNIFFAEAVWRLQHETKRRTTRLLITFFYYILGNYRNTFDQIEFKPINEKI